jgi:hypothetical protein
MQNLTSFDGPDRRRWIRFPVKLDVHYAVKGRRAIRGTGETVNISSHGLLITSAHDLSPGTSIGVVIEWPVSLANTRSLRLHIGGKIIRSDCGLVAVQFRGYEMRTRIGSSGATKEL